MYTYKYLFLNIFRIALSNDFERDIIIASNNLGYDDTADIKDEDVSVAGLRVSPVAGGSACARTGC